MLTAEIQAGLLRRLTHNLTGQVLIDSGATALPFAELTGDGADGEWRGEVTERTPGRVRYRLTHAGGGVLDVAWRADTTTADIIVDVTRESAEAVGEMVFPLAGVDIGSFAAVLPVGFGECEVIRGPRAGTFNAGYSSMMAMSFFLFEGESGSWAIALNDADDSPKSFVLEAAGTVAGVKITQGFYGNSRKRRMLPIRFQACAGSWHALADRFASEWLEKGLGMTPLSRQPAWIRGIRASVGVDHGLDLAELDKLAAQLIPEQTLLYVSYWRTHSFDYGYPDYTPSDAFRAWCSRARALGFHVAAHFNMHGVNKGMEEYVERFRPGMNPDDPGWGIQDPDTGFLMWSMDKGKSGHYYVSSSFQPWREFYVSAVKAAVDCGIDVIHLDESHTAMTCPAQNQDIPNIFAGNIALHKALRMAYPHVALQGEQFNDMNMRHAAFAQNTANAEHTVAHRIFSRFVKFVKRPDGSDLNSERAGYENLGVKLPWGDVPLREGVVEEMRAFQDYALDLAPDLGRAAHQVFGYRGRDGVIAFLERSEHISGLGVCLPDGTKEMFNVSHSGITEYAGGTLPGWLLYDGDRLLALDPRRNYRFGKGTMPRQEFHLSQVPEDFRLWRGVTGHEKTTYIVEFTGRGPVRATVPDQLAELYVNGDRQQPEVGSLSFTASGETSLIAFAPGPELALGLLNAMPWTVDGLVPGQGTPSFTPRGTGFFHHAGACANIVGRLPVAPSLTLRGKLIIDPHAKNGMAGTVQINGRQVLAVDNTGPPWPPKPFEVDISEFAGKQVMIQFATSGKDGYNYGGWEGFGIWER